MSNDINFRGVWGVDPIGMIAIHLSLQGDLGGRQIG